MNMEEFLCPACGVPLRMKYHGMYGSFEERCLGCGADLVFKVARGSCHVSLGFQRSGMHGPILRSSSMQF